jgi:hypothetical protein
VLRRVAIGAAALVALLALAVFLVDWEELARGGGPFDRDRAWQGQHMCGARWRGPRLALRPGRRRS